MKESEQSRMLRTELYTKLRGIQHQLGVVHSFFQNSMEHIDCSGLNVETEVNYVHDKIDDMIKELKYVNTRIHSLVEKHHRGNEDDI